MSILILWARALIGFITGLLPRVCWLASSDVLANAHQPTLCLPRLQVSTAFVGGDKTHRAKLVTSNLLQSYAAGVVCKVNYAVRKTAYRSGAQAADECATELRAAVERGAWGEFLSADGEGCGNVEGESKKGQGV